jgi:hypothetical protein
MGRRHAVRELDDEQFTFVIDSIIANRTDREISSAFGEKFASPLAKSSLNRWRSAAGDELAERYRLVRYQARQLLVDLKEEDQDAFQVVMRNIEDRLLTATREVIAADPVQMLKIRLDEEKRRLKERELKLKERLLDLEIAKAKAVDPAAMPNQVLEQLLEFIGDDTAGLRWFRQHSEKLNEFLVTKYSAPF